MTALESTVATLSSSMNASINSSISKALDAKLPLYFEQFRRELSCSFGTCSSSKPDPPTILPDSTDPPLLNHLRPSRELFDGGGMNPRQPFQLRDDFPRFSPGEDPLAWIYKAEQYFAYYHTADHLKVLTVSFHLDGEALHWFRWLDCLQSTPRWDDFAPAFCREFGPSDFEDYTESLFKLRQTGTLKDYIVEFRRLATRTSDVGHVLLKSCFLRGLKKELRFNVKLLRPNTVHEAISLALQIEAKHNELKIPAPKQSFTPKNTTPTP